MAGTGYTTRNTGNRMTRSWITPQDRSGRTAARSLLVCSLQIVVDHRYIGGTRYGHPSVGRPHVAFHVRHNPWPAAGGQAVGRSGAGAAWHWLQ